MRDRLIELIAKSNLVLVDGGIHPDTHQAQEALADYLLANGIVVPPCKVGAIAYYVDKGRMRETTVREINFGINNAWWICIDFACEEDCDDCPFESWSQDYSGEWTCGGAYGTWVVNNEDFGKTVFLTREEAEKALAERS